MARVYHLMGMLPSETSVPFLDDYLTGIYSVYSMRKVVSTYSGSCMRIQRTSDSTQQDIGFNVDGHIDTTAIETFCSGLGNIGRVARWYDQSGNGNDVEMIGIASAPDIFTSGAVLSAPDWSGNCVLRSVNTNGTHSVTTVLSKSLRFIKDNVRCYIELSENYNSNTAFSAFLVPPGDSELQCGIHRDSPVGYTRYDFAWADIGGNDAQRTNVFNIGEAAQANQIKMRLDGVALIPGSNGNSGTQPSGNYGTGLNYYLGARGNSVSNGADMQLYTVAIYHSEPTGSTLSDIENVVDFTL